MMAFITAIEQIGAQLQDLQAPVSELQVLPQGYRHFVSA